jgi:hypothetical protein
MKKREEDNASLEQLEVSFKGLALEGDVITEMNLKQSGLAPNVVEFFKTALPVAGDGEGYDYKTYLHKTFGK